MFEPLDKTPCAGRRGMLAALAVVVCLPGCATLQEIAALRSVGFSLAGATGGTLAGVSIDSARTFNELSALDIGRVAAAVARGELPLEANLLVRAANPADNAQARLVGFDWTLFLDGQETVSGALNQEFVLPPGQPVNVPVRVRVDLLDFFDRQLEQVVNLALAVAGQGDPQRVRLEATPSIQTPLGPIRYPAPIPIEYEVARR
jgi:hypothetical protein